MTMATEKRLGPLGGERVIIFDKQIQRKAKFERLFRLWVRLRREYWHSCHAGPVQNHAPVPAGTADSFTPTRDRGIQPTTFTFDDIEELPVLMCSEDVSELIQVARRQGVTAAGIVRGLIRDYLQRLRAAF
jgi:hypothetical protein